MFPILTPKHRVLALAIASVMTVAAFASAPGAFAATPSTSGDVAETPAGDPPAQYPEQALEAGHSGFAMVQCTVGIDGRTSDCAVTKSHGDVHFGDAALDFARAETFHPALHNGVPVAKMHDWRVNFILQ